MKKVQIMCRYKVRLNHFYESNKAVFPNLFGTFTRLKSTLGESLAKIYNFDPQMIGIVHFIVFDVTVFISLFLCLLLNAFITLNSSS